MPSKKELKRIAPELIVILSSLFVDVVLVVAVVFFSIQLLWLQILLPSTFALIVPFSLQAYNKWTAMPRLEIRYESDRKNELYELYHHKDVPMRRLVVDYSRLESWDVSTGMPRRLTPLYTKGLANFILVGLRNTGNNTARNCHVKLWIFLDQTFSKPFDNPFSLYWFHDPRSQRGLPPSIFNLPAKDEQFLAICHMEKFMPVFLFDDHGQFTFRRQTKLENLPKGILSFFIKVIAYCENAESIEKCFKIRKRDYDHFEMEETECPSARRRD